MYQVNLSSNYQVNAAFTPPVPLLTPPPQPPPPALLDLPGDGRMEVQEVSGSGKGGVLKEEERPFLWLQICWGWQWGVELLGGGGWRWLGGVTGGDGRNMWAATAARQNTISRPLTDCQLQLTSHPSPPPPATTTLHCLYRNLILHPPSSIFAPFHSARRRLPEIALALSSHGEGRGRGRGWWLEIKIHKKVRVDPKITAECFCLPDTENRMRTRARNHVRIQTK